MTGQSYEQTDSDREGVEKLLGELELAIMEIVWEADGALTVRDVLNRLTPTRDLAYTTVMTVMTRLVDKGLLTRTLRGKAYVYEPALTRKGFLRNRARQMVRALLDNFGEVAIAQFIAELDRVAPERLAALERLLAERRGEEM